jgi:hypothetical protein
MQMSELANKKEMHGNSPYKASPFSGWSNSVKGVTIDWSLTLPPRLF